MEAVIFDGKEYVKAAVLAERFKYTQDYLGQLCRGKKVDARLVGRAWYINLDSLNTHKKTRYKAPEKLPEADTASHKPSSQNYISRIDVEPVLKKKTVNIIRNEAGRLTEFQVKYEKDDYSLIPKMSHQAVLKDIKVLPAGAEDLSVKSEKESLRITTFKADSLPEVYLKGVLKINGLPEVTEEIPKIIPEKQPELVKNHLEIKKEPLPPAIDHGKKVSSNVKKPIKIKLYRKDMAVVPDKSASERNIKPVKFSTSTQTQAVRTLPRQEIKKDKEIRVEVAKVSNPVKVTKSKKQAVVEVIPYATTKALVVLLLAGLLAGLLFSINTITTYKNGSVTNDWHISSDKFLEIGMLFSK